MSMIGCSNNDRTRVQPIKRLNDGIDYTLELAQLVPIITQFRDGIHFIKKKDSVPRRYEIKN